MTEKISTTLSSNEFIPDHPHYSNSPRKENSLSLEFNTSSLSFEAEWLSQKDDGMNLITERSYLYFEFGSWDEVTKFIEFFERPIPDVSGTNRRFDMEVDAIFRDSRNDIDTRISHVLVFMTSDRIIFETMEGQNPVAFYWQSMEGGEPQDTNNLDKIRSFFSKIQNAIPNDEFILDGIEKTHFDEELYERAISKLQNGHPQNAVQDAFIVLEERLRDVGEQPQEKHGVDLAEEVVGPQGPISIGKTSSEEQGAHLFLRGLLQSFRNPSNHRFVGGLDSGYAIDVIHMVNLTLRTIEQSAEKEVGEDIG